MKAQITLFMIIGIVAVAILLALLFFTGRDTPEPSSTVAADFEPLRAYVDDCLRGIAVEGLRLMGTQGGYLYRDQGGLKTNPTGAQGTLYLSSDGRRVPYRIQLPVSGGVCSSDWPSGEYPVRAAIPYPYGGTWRFGDTAYLADKKLAQPDCFGRRIPLDVDSAATHLATYVESHVVDRCTFESFPTLEVEVGEPSISATASTRLLTFSARWPLTARTTTSRTTLDAWTVPISFNLRSVYQAANDLLRRDTSDPTYDLSQRSPTFAVQIDRSVLGEDDLITLTSDERLEGERYVLAFARMNRPPVIEFVHDYTLPPLPAGGELTASDIGGTLIAHDPDEDETDTYLLVGLTVPDTILRPGEPYSIIGSQVAVAFVATDGTYQDRQSIGTDGNPLVIS